MSREENRRELPEGVVTQSGACRYCGQMHLIHASGCMDDERLVYEATMMCDCGGAREYQRKVQRQNRAEEALDRVLGTEQQGLTDHTAEAFRMILRALTDYQIDSASFTLFNGTRITMRNGKEKTEIKKTRKLEISETIKQ